MLTKIQALKERMAQEEGFSLVEVMVAILVIGILTAIVVPTYINSQNELNSQKTRAALQSAGLAIEQEAGDNNGLYPTYLPNELKNNPETSKFVYSYSNGRTSWCIQAPSTVGKLFISSSSGGKVISTTCTEENIAEGSDTPWRTPIVATPGTPIIASHAWASNETSARTTLNIPAGSCVLDASDTAEWGPKTTLEYRIKAVNVNRGNEELLSPWGAGTSVSMQLPGWLPGETVRYSAQTRCVITNGIDHPYRSEFSPEVQRNIAMFVVNPVDFSVTTAAWVDNATFRASASWEANAFCPAGERQYRLKVASSGGSTMTGATTWRSWASSQSSDVTAWTSGGTTTFTHTVGCLLPTGARVASTDTVEVVNNTLRPPTAPTGLAAVANVVYNSPATPTGMEWNTVTCQTGTPQYLVTRTLGGSWNSGWVTASEITLNLTPEVNYAHTVTAKCVSGSVSSINSPASAALAFKAEFVTPWEPAAAPTGLTLTVATTSTTKSNHKLTWSAATCTSPGSVIQYRPARTTIDGDSLGSNPTFASAWQTSLSYTIPSSWLKFGSTIGVKVQSRCYNATSGLASVDSGATSAEKKGTLGIDAPDYPGRPTVSTAGRVTIPAATCPTDTTAKYRVEELNANTYQKTGDVYLNYSTSRAFNSSATKSNHNGWSGVSATGSTFVIRCDGANHTASSGYTYGYWYWGGSVSGVYSYAQG